MPWRPSSRRRVLAVLAVIGGAVYLSVLAGTFLLAGPAEQRFGAPPATPGSLHVYAEIIDVQPVRQSARLRLLVTPDPSLRGLRAASAGRDVMVLVDDGSARQELAFRANERMPPVEMDADFSDGSVFTYPFDRYRLGLQVQAVAGTPQAPGAALPIALTVWCELGGFRADAREITGGQGAATVEGEGVRLEVRVRRHPVLAWFALVAYAAMIALAVSALTVGSLVYLGRRPPEATLVAATAAITFTLLALRNALPGAPPLGVLPDLAVFLWVEIAAVIGLSLVVVAWTRGAPPRP